MVKAFPEPIRELLVYHFCILDSTPQFVLVNIFIPEGAMIRTLEKLKVRLRRMSNEETAEYVQGKVTREKMMEEGSEDDILGGIARRESIRQNS